MGYGFFKPTKYKLILFAAMSALLLYMPVIPTLTASVPDAPAYGWTLSPAAYSLMGSSVPSQYFGVASGGAGGMMSMLVVLTAGYLVACAIAYVFHSMHK